MYSHSTRGAALVGLVTLLVFNLLHVSTCFDSSYLLRPRGSSAIVMPWSNLTSDHQNVHELLTTGRAAASGPDLRLLLQSL